MVTYEPEVVQEFAQRLYRQALAIQVVYPLLGLAAGFLLAGSTMTRIGTTTVAVFGGVLALLGFAVARSRAFLLRLEAQKALCQVRIEENTRRAAEAPRAAGAA